MGELVITLLMANIVWKIFIPQIYIDFHGCYCLTACLYAKCWNLIGWIMERESSIHFYIDVPDPGVRTIYTVSIKVKTEDFWEDCIEAIDRGREK